MWFRRYHLLSYQLINRSYPTCTMRVAVVPETNIESSEIERRVTGAVAYAITFPLQDKMNVRAMFIHLHPPPSFIYCKDCICLDCFWFSGDNFSPKELCLFIYGNCINNKFYQVWLDIIFTGTHLILILVHIFIE